jgi:hypothetical protein
MKSIVNPTITVRDTANSHTDAWQTSAIAHELGQPLTSMIHNAQALPMMIAADRATIW